ncbi:MAG: hypothetical protein GVY36_11880 [Verrucomicrobia bacterium]|jgi:hypothetical protein|nr:hypothetical protein [Verrucomicrobiota bacterium]
MSRKINRAFAVFLVAALVVVLGFTGAFIVRDAGTDSDSLIDKPLIPAQSEPRISGEAAPEAMREEEDEAEEIATEMTRERPDQMVEDLEMPDQAAPSQAQPPELPNPPDSPFAETPDMLGQESFRIDPPMQEIGEAWINDTGRSDFSMPITGGKVLDIEVDRFEMIGEDGGEFTGSVKGRPGSSVRLSYRGSSEAGVIRMPSENRLIRIMPGRDGGVVVQERDLAMAERANAEIPANMEIPPVPDFIPPSPPGMEELEPPSN